MLVVLTTTSTSEEAETLAHLLVGNKLAACVQILPKMKSIYFWEGKVMTEPEHLLLIKTRDENFDDVSRFIRRNHTYDAPEIVAIRADRISEDYLKWIGDTLS